MRSIFVLTTLVAVSMPAMNIFAADEDVEFFEKKIRPVLVRHCYQCHSQAAAKSNKLKGGLMLDSRQATLLGGESGAAVVPSKPGESSLLSAMRYEDFEMPPKGKLPDAVIADFEKWIKSGAADPRDNPTVKKGQSIDIEAGRKHWSYRPLQKATRPDVIDESWPHNDVDYFVLGRLEKNGWRPAADADPETLIRRIYYALIGLPPTPDEVDAFIADPSDTAYEAMVDRLLASPRFGERWGRHWLDVARFGESNTLRGTVFSQAWRYRDWVIEAFNNDMPFDQFIRDQIAGDLLEADDWQDRRRKLTATSFWTLGNTNFENQDKKQLVMDVVDEQLETIGRAFLAQTIGCARCHDHKFDPIGAHDYYALAGILKNTKTLKHANLSRWLEAPLPVSPKVEAEITKHEAAVSELTQQIAAVKQELGGKPAKTTAAIKFVKRESLPGIVIDDKMATKTGDWMDSTFSGTYVDAGYIHDRGAKNGAMKVTFETRVPKNGEYEVRISYTYSSNRSTKTPVHVSFAAAETKSFRVNQRRRPSIDGKFHSLGKFDFVTDEPARVVISNDGTDGVVIVDAVQFLSMEDLRDSVTKTKSAKDAKPKTASVDPKSKQDKAELQAKLKNMEADLKKLRESGPARDMVMTVFEEDKLGNTHIHIRGIVHNLGPEVPRGFLRVAHYGETPKFTDKESGRRELANWLADEKNPLTSRVIVNRLWHWMFGVGIVRTTDNFGTVGETPSHPELLEYLASQFQRDGWSVKQTIRRLALSRAFRMSSSSTQPAAAANAQPSEVMAADSDVENRLLWRMNRHRLEAESIRDTILSVSGQLSLETGGPLFPARQTVDYDFKYTGTRRSVYAPVFRNSLPEIFEIFDFANPSMVVGKRSTSTVAPQALFMMNNPMVLEHSRKAAERLLTDTSISSTGDRIMHAYRVTLGRRPTSAQQQLATRYINEAQDGKELEAWADLFHTLFASMDFRYVD